MPSTFAQSSPGEPKKTPYSGVQDQHTPPGGGKPPGNGNLSFNQFGQSIRPRLAAATDSLMLARSYSRKGGLGLAARYMLNRGESRYGAPPRVRQVLTSEHLESEGGSGIYGEPGPSTGEPY